MTCDETIGMHACASAANPQAFRSHAEKEPVKMPTPTIMPEAPKIPAAPTVLPESPKVTREAVKAMARPTRCSNCGAPLGVSQEDVIITCKYCGFTITLATQVEIKKHGMLENRLYKPHACMHKF